MVARGETTKAAIQPNNLRHWYFPNLMLTGRVPKDFINVPLNINLSRLHFQQPLSAHGSFILSPIISIKYYRRLRIRGTDSLETQSKHQVPPWQLPKRIWTICRPWPKTPMGFVHKHWPWNKLSWRAGTNLHFHDLRIMSWSQESWLLEQSLRNSPACEQGKIGKR